METLASGEDNLIIKKCPCESTDNKGGKSIDSCCSNKVMMRTSRLLEPFQPVVRCLGVRQSSKFENARDKKVPSGLLMQQQWQHLLRFQ